MRNLFCFLLLIGLSFSAAAQKVYFIYLQTDNNNPFYVKMNDKIYSSATSGYLILSNLVDSTYHFSVGFPSSKTESKFTVVLSGKDRGFLIKNFQTGLGLFDLQALTITQEEKEQTSDNIQYQKRNDEFASLLSKAANDTSILYAVVVTKQEVPPQKDVVVENSKPVTEENKPKREESIPVKDTVAVTPPGLLTEIKTPDTTAVKTTDLALQNKTEEKTAQQDIIKSNQDSAAVKPLEINSNAAEMKDTVAIVPEESFKRSVVKKYSESSTSEGFGLVYFDKDDKGTDTIQLLIPNPKFIIRSGETETSQSSDQLLKREELKTDSTVQSPIIVSTNSGVNPKANCTAIATDNDFLKLRRNMAAKGTDEAMVEEAKKTFKAKCFSTEQVKNLSTLFLTSAGKYQFFDAAYLHVSDQEQFSSLQKEIRDEYYLKRFKALIGD